MSGDVERNPGPVDDVNTLSFFHLNVRSIRKKMDFVKCNFLNFDILCFTETHLTSQIISDHINLEGFNGIYGKDVSAYSSGILEYVSENLISRRKVEFERPLVDPVWVEIQTGKVSQFEYASVVWDGCTQYEKDTLEKIQNEAARIVTGLTRSVTLRNLYNEINWYHLWIDVIIKNF